MLFSIITPVYNRSDCVARCIQSVIEQDFSDWEMVIVDDGSADNTFEIAEKTAAQDSRIRPFRFAQNRGTNAARNKAIAEAKGDFCLILDSDDQLVSGALSQIARVINSNAKYQYFLFAADDRKEYYTKILPSGFNQQEFSFEDWLTGKISGDFIHVIKRELMQHNIFDEKVRIFEFLTFLMMYKESSKQLFTNIVTTSRERNRNDSATLESCFFTPGALLKKEIVYEKTVKTFREDLIAFHAEKQYAACLQKLCLFTLLQGKYKEMDTWVLELQSQHQTVPVYYKILRSLHLGKLFFQFVSLYSQIKAKVRTSK